MYFCLPIPRVICLLPHRPPDARSPKHLTYVIYGLSQCLWCKPVVRVFVRHHFAVSFGNGEPAGEQWTREGPINWRGETRTKEKRGEFVVGAIDPSSVSVRTWRRWRRGATSLSECLLNTTPKSNFDTKIELPEQIVQVCSLVVETGRLGNYFKS